MESVSYKYKNLIEHTNYIPCTLEEGARVGVMLLVGNEAAEISGELDRLNSSTLRSMFPDAASTDVDAIDAEASSVGYEEIMYVEN